MRSAASALVLLSIVGLGLGGCVSTERPVRSAAATVAPPATPGRYASLASEPFRVPSIDTARIPDRYLRHEVDYQTAEMPGTIVIDTAARHLYLVQANGRAIRYGVGVGKEGMSWSGVASVGVKRSWPDWYPPKEMIARRPDIEQSIQQLPSGRGLPGGEANPLGARALYLYQEGKDTLYRIHGTLEPYTMGQAVSSGCVRMINQDAIDLFSRVDVGTRVVVLPDGPRGAPVASRDEPPRAAFEPQQADIGGRDERYGANAVFAEGYRRSADLVPPADVGYPVARGGPRPEWDEDGYGQDEAPQASYGSRSSSWYR